MDLPGDGYQADGHAVLMVRTDRGDFTLYNKTDAVLPWNRTGYVFAKREGQDSTAWVSLGGATPRTATEGPELILYRASTAALLSLARSEP